MWIDSAPAPSRHWTGQRFAPRCDVTVTRRRRTHTTFTAGHHRECDVPVTAKLSRKLYDKLGEEVANELVDWFNQVDATYRADLRELNELNYARFEAKLEQRLAEFAARWKGRLSELDSKWETLFLLRNRRRLEAERRRLSLYFTSRPHPLAPPHISLTPQTPLPIRGEGGPALHFVPPLRKPERG